MLHAHEMMRRRKAVELEASPVVCDDRSSGPGNAQQRVSERRHADAIECNTANVRVLCSATMSAKAQQQSYQQEGNSD